MDTPRLDATKKLLIKELMEQRKKKSEEKNRDTLEEVIKNDDVIESYIKTYIKEMSEEILNIEKDKIINEALKEKEAIINEGKKQKQILIDEGKREVEKSKAMYAIEKAKNLFRDGILIAFIIGIFVNQFTDLITPIKGLLSKGSKTVTFIITFVIVSVLAFIIYMVVKRYYFSKVEEYIKNDGIGV